MIIDSRTIEKDSCLETDVCILGAGIAGITLAHEFAGSKFKVCLLESAGIGPDNASQALYWGENIGLAYYPLDTARACGFGGSGHRWNINLYDNSFGVRLHPLDRLDFEQRDWVPNSGWPFNKAHLDPFYARAQAVCKIGPYTYDAKDWEDPQQTPRLPFLNSRVETTIFQFAHRLTFIEDHRHKIDQAENLTTFTYANIIRLETDESGRTVTRLRAKCLNGNAFWVKAQKVILAMGATYGRVASSRPTIPWWAAPGCFESIGSTIHRSWEN
jgi:glycine/D-amino acid oxidase-like deaminating enzyme